MVFVKKVTSFTLIKFLEKIILVKQFKLSICIQTYNRSKFLNECLQNAITAINYANATVEIVISDNCGSDDTPKVVAHWQTIYPFIRYHRNDKNIFEMNFRRVVQLASSEYVWTLGDDDKIVEDGVKRILESIDYGYDFIICNCIQGKKEKAIIPLDLKVKNQKEILEKIGIWYLGSISATVAKKELMLALPDEEYQGFVEYGLVHAYACLVGISGGCKPFFIPKPILKIPFTQIYRSDPEWVRSYSETMIPKIAIMGPALISKKLVQYNYSKASVTNAKNHVVKNSILPIIIGEKAEQKNTKTIVELVSLHYRDCWTYWFLILPIRLLPNFIFAIARNYYRNFIKK